MSDGADAAGHAIGDDPCTVTGIRAIDEPGEGLVELQVTVGCSRASLWKDRPGKHPWFGRAGLVRRTIHRSPAGHPAALLRQVRDLGDLLVFLNGAVLLQPACQGLVVYSNGWPVRRYLLAPAALVLTGQDSARRTFRAFPGEDDYGRNHRGVGHHCRRRSGWDLSRHLPE